MAPSRQARFQAVVTDSDYDTLAPLEEVIRRAGGEVRLAQARSEDELIACCRDADALVVEYAQITPGVLRALLRCRVIVRLGVGFDCVDVRTATEEGICVANVPDYCEEEVSDHTLALIVSAVRKVTLYDRGIRRGTWDFKIGIPIRRIADLTVGLVGFGRLGRAVAAKILPLGCRVLAHDPFVTPEAVAEAAVELVGLPELLARADVVSLHVPLNQHTHHLIGEAAFRQMRPGAVLINTSRGLVVDERALVRALEERRIGGAALDVVEEEPLPPGHPLARLENVTLTPHVAWYSDRSIGELQRRAADEVVRVMNGEPPRHLVNPEVKERRR